MKKTELSVSFGTEQDSFEFGMQVEGHYRTTFKDPDRVRVINHAEYNNNIYTDVFFPSSISDQEYELIRAWAKDRNARSIRRTLEEIFPS